VPSIPEPTWAAKACLGVRVAAAAVPAAGLEGGRAAAPPAPSAGLVRLETSPPETPPNALPYREMQRLRRAHRRQLRLFKSVSCVGDHHKERTDSRGRRLKPWFVTLTYRPDVEWRPRHIAAYVKRLEKWHSRHGEKLRYVWVGEQHKSGRIHYHLIAFLRRDLALPKPDKSGMWPHGMSQRQEARKGIGYLMKYASKCAQVSKPWPLGMRLHGHGGLEPCERVRRAWWVLPKYIREQVEPEWRVRRCRGGGWWSPETSEWWPAWGASCLLSGGFVCENDI